MVKLMGHLGIALLWAVPAWFVWEPRVSLAFVGFVLSTAMLPDVDLVLRDVLPIVHHGVTHTVVSVAVVSLIAGALVEYGLRSWLERRWFRRRGITVSSGALFLFVAGGFLLGGLSHLFADMLSAPDIADPIEPFWPLFDKPWSIDVLWYASTPWNVGLLAVGSAIHVALAYLDVRVEHPYSISVET